MKFSKKKNFLKMLETEPNLNMISQVTFSSESSSCSCFYIFKIFFFFSNFLILEQVDSTGIFSLFWIFFSFGAFRAFLRFSNLSNLSSVSTLKIFLDFQFNKLLLALILSKLPNFFHLSGFRHLEVK